MVADPADRPAFSEVSLPGPDAQAILELRDLSKRFGETQAVAPLSLLIHSGDFLAVLGPSGCGKTTLLRMIGGFISPTSGTILIDGLDVTRQGPERRPTNMVFQGYGLFPHMTVRQNVAYGLRMAGVPKDEMEARAAEVIDLVHLGDLAGRHIGQLSGGQQQRVALARALVMRPKVLLLDEPLGALDLKLRRAMQEELRRIHREIGGTFVFVTHDQGEALGLANRIAVMNDGRVEQEGSPEEIYRQPRTRFVSTFIGEANIIAGRIKRGQFRMSVGGECIARALPDGPAHLVVRPEDMEIDALDEEGRVGVDARVVDVIYLGAYRQYKLALLDGTEISVNRGGDGSASPFVTGDSVRVSWLPEDHRIIGP